MVISMPKGSDCWLTCLKLSCTPAATPCFPGVVSRNNLSCQQASEELDNSASVQFVRDSVVQQHLHSNNSHHQDRGGHDYRAALTLGALSDGMSARCLVRWKDTASTTSV